MHETRWPKAKDKLFRATGKKLLSTSWLSNNWLCFPDAYKNAADRLVDALPDVGGSNPVEDDLVFPIVFLYRHYLELQLKSLALHIEQFASRSIPEGTLGRHFLIPIWEYLREQSEGLGYSSVDPERNKKLDRLIREFDRFDNRSFSFRYPTDKKLKGIKLPQAISMTNLKDVMIAIYNALGSLEQVIQLEGEWRAGTPE